VTADPATSDPAVLPAGLRDIIQAATASRRRGASGRNFILDLNVDAGASARPPPGRSTRAQSIEVGPGGRGGADPGLARRGRTGMSFASSERDRAPALAALWRTGGGPIPGRLELVEGDALKLDPAALAPASRRIVAQTCRNNYRDPRGWLLRWL